jgi:putative spermidine/putrescine transport system permease protein
MRLSRTARIVLGCITAAGLAVVYAPLLLVLLNSFNADRSFGWPPSGLTGEWWRAALRNHGARDALLTSLKAGLAATGIALGLGTMAAYAVHRHRFFGRRTVSFLLVLPIALPGIVSGIALNAAFRTVLDPLGIGFGLFTVVVGHATFCVVVVFNNVAARLRRIAPSMAEASADLGASRPCVRRSSRARCSPSRSPSTRSW